MRKTTQFPDSSFHSVKTEYQCFAYACSFSMPSFSGYCIPGSIEVQILRPQLIIALCILELPVLSDYRLDHWYVLIYEAILNLFPSYLFDFIHLKNAWSYCLCSVTHSQDLILLSVPREHLKMGGERVQLAICKFSL